MNKNNKTPFEILLSLLDNTIDESGNNFFKKVLLELEKIFDAQLVFIMKKDDFKIIHSTKNITKYINLSSEIFDTKTILTINRKIDNKIFHYICIKNLEQKTLAYVLIFTEKEISLSKEIQNILEVYSRKFSKELVLEEEKKTNIEIQKKLKKLAIVDELTGLYNRRYFEKVCNDIFLQVKRASVNANLAYLDLDNFKYINDNFGHLDGDFVLKKFGEVLLEQSRKGVDYIFRLGGEEFAIISINTQLNHSYDHLARIMTKTIEIFRETKFKEITFSVGLVEFNKNFKSHEEIVSLADKKMYRAKKAGKNIIVK